ncbi:MAG: 50S ribosomal protein L24 [Candidatus Kerfeldbacteria bacterium]|nr:50S ribosomal protein L24 [Candidatus Kerfeldbacteria bacterium]
MPRTVRPATLPKLRSGDTVKVMAGASRGKQGKITQVFPRQLLAVVEGVNLRKKSVRTRRQGQKGEIIQFYAPVAMSNLLVVCPHCSKTTRVSIIRSDGKRQRICKKCKQALDK